MWDRWSRPYIERIIQATKREHPTVPITVYANGSGGLLERLGSTGADVVGLDWTVDMADARARLGPAVSVQACTDLWPRMDLCRAHNTVTVYHCNCVPQLAAILPVFDFPHDAVPQAICLPHCQHADGVSELDAATPRCRL